MEIEQTSRSRITRVMDWLREVAEVVEARPIDLLEARVQRLERQLAAARQGEAK